MIRGRRVQKRIVETHLEIGIRGLPDLPPTEPTSNLSHPLILPAFGAAEIPLGVISFEFTHGSNTFFLAFWASQSAARLFDAS